MKTDRTLVALRLLLGFYILLSLVLAALNQGTNEEIARKVAPWWHFSENELKTALILVCGYLTLSIKKKKGRITKQKANLAFLFATALCIHILLPLFTGNPELYFFAMPLPWTTLPLQAGFEQSSFFQSHQYTLGLDGIAWAIAFFWVYSACIAIGTILLGRRLHCSHLCLFNGFAAEVFDLAIPLFGKRKRPSAKMLKHLDWLRYLFLGIALLFTIFWLYPAKHLPSQSISVMRTLELIWYLGANLILAMGFWVASQPRRYCHLCPLGTVLALLAKLGGMRITTAKTSCIGCGACDRACPATISIMAMAREGKPVISDRCVGCGHCIDACPQKTLGYETGFLRWISKRFP
ncbi:MAG: 4Fe-4S binding protein [Sphaerochaeta sp.]|nr:4Fe-4S binding protein [Sphaerochaeta sp.]